MSAVSPYMGATVSEGTLRMQDLIPAFEQALNGVAPFAYAQLLLQPFDRVPSDARIDYRDPWWDTEDAQSYCQMLTEALEENSPEGCYFSAHEGDGALFGFWLSDEAGEV